MRALRHCHDLVHQPEHLNPCSASDARMTWSRGRLAGASGSRYLRRDVRNDQRDAQAHMTPPPRLERDDGS
jgi:hypothetical protein